MLMYSSIATSYHRLTCHHHHRRLLSSCSSSSFRLPLDHPPLVAASSSSAHYHHYLIAKEGPYSRVSTTGPQYQYNNSIHNHSTSPAPTTSTPTSLFVYPLSNMKFQLAPFLSALSLSSSSSAFQTRQLTRSRAFVHKKSYHNAVVSTQLQQQQQRRHLASTSTSHRMTESLADIDPIITTTTSPTNTTNNAQPEKKKDDGGHCETTQEGEVLSYYQTTSGSFAVVKVCEEDLMILPPEQTSLSAAGVGVAGGADGSIPTVMEEGDKVELANALFGKTSSSSTSSSMTAAATKGNDKGLLADGDITGRTVTFSNSSKGMIVAHRHPIAFVLLDSGSSPATTTEVVVNGNKDACSISTKQMTLDPTSIPSGSTVDYLGRHVSVLKDGSVSRSLPRAASSSSAGEIDIASGIGIGTTITSLDNEDGAISLSVDGSSIASDRKKDRPIFVPIPKISDIGLIDSPLVTGITAIDALTPIGRGQNMLVIGQEEDAEEEKTGVNKRGWMLSLLRNVVENHKSHPSGKGVRCYYGLTSGDSKVRASVLNGIKEAGIQDDIVTVVSNHDDSAPADTNGDASSITEAAAMEAAEAVAVAAAACTLGEHHALSTGGDAVVIIDDINLHKSLWDITTQELVKVYGVNAVVAADLNGGSSSEMRGFFSGLIQRAARFKTKKGGGSVTLILLSTLPNSNHDSEKNNDSEEDEPTFEASDFDSMSEKIKARIEMLVKAKVPLTPTNLRKIQISVPKPSATENARRLALQHVEDLISMSDGQITLCEALVQQGRSPPMDPSRSLTRVGVGADTKSCRADAPALRSVVGSLRFEFQQAMDVIDSSPSSNSPPTTASGMGDNTKQVRRRDAFLLAMFQEPNDMRRLSQECISLLAASRGHLDKVLANNGGGGGVIVGSLEGKKAIEGMLDYVETEAGEIMQSIDETLDLSLDERNVLEEAIAAYFE